MVKAKERMDSLFKTGILCCRLWCQSFSQGIMICSEKRLKFNSTQERKFVTTNIVYVQKYRFKMQPRISKRGRVRLVVRLSVDSSVGPYVGSSIGLSVSLSVSPSISPSVSPSITPSVLRFVRRSFRRSVRRFVPCIAAKNIVFCLKTAIFTQKHHFSPIS